MIFGYARVSTLDQNLELQIDALLKYGAEELFKEKVTGGKVERQQLNQMLQLLRKGDKVVVYKLDRISRSTKHLIELSELFEQKEVDFISIEDHIDTTNPMGRFFFRTMASIAELERDIIIERTKAGLTAARSRGRLGGRPPTDTKTERLILKMYNSKQHTISEIERAANVSKSTIYRIVNRKGHNTNN